MSLEVEIQRSRSLIRDYEAQGKSALRDCEEARLGGLLTALRLAGGNTSGCVHGVHQAAGMDHGRTIWRCTTCGERSS